MRCRDVQRKLSAYSDGELPEPEAAEVGKHISECSACGREAESLMVMWERVGAVPEIEASPFFWARLEARIDRAEEQRFSFARIFNGLYRYLVPATAIAASILGLWIGDTLYNAYESDTSENWEQVAAALHLDTLQDIPDQSLGSSYIQLALDQVQ